MSFSTLIFPFAMLPLALLLYFAVPKRMKNAVLLLCSLLFFAWGRPQYLLLLLCSLVFNYATGLLLDGQKKEKARVTLASAVVVNLLLLACFKYSDALLSALGKLLGMAWADDALPMPLGISFFTFSILSYLFDVYRKKAPAARNFLNFALYVSFFPKLVSGPIVPYAAMEPQLAERRVTAEQFGGGARLFLIGLAKKLLLANTLGTSFYALSALPPERLSVLGAWLGALAYALMLYFDFSGYSDMAIGLAGMFGFRFAKNFDYPYLSGSLTEFWRRWHISLGAWFRDYVYIPLGGSRAGKLRTIGNLLLVWLLTGIWHGASWTFVLWGVYYGILLVLEKFVFARLLPHLPGAVRHFLTLLLVLLGWVFFFSPTVGGAFGWLGRMFGMGGSIAGAAAKYQLAASWRVLLVGVIGATPVASRVGRRLLQRGAAGQVLSVVFFAMLLLLCIACMMNDTYSSFLYFQF